MGEPTDEVGLIVDELVGGSAEHFYNVYSERFNQDYGQKLFIEATGFAFFVLRYNKNRPMIAKLYYPSPHATRPCKIVSVHVYDTMCSIFTMSND